MSSQIRQALVRFRDSAVEAVRQNLSFDQRAFATLEPGGKPRGRALLAHVIEPFVKPDAGLMRTHNHFSEVRAIADTLLGMGFTVDLISYLNYSFKPRRDYDLALLGRIHFEAIAERLNPGCRKVVHLDTSHWLHNNRAVFRRAAELCGRRGVALASHKLLECNWAIEHADCATLLGNEFVYRSYAFAGKPVYQLPNIATTLYPSPEGKDFEACRRRFAWIGSEGLVHKGLDLVLEAFAGMPDHHLTVCGPVDRDPHFERAFRSELYGLPNIDTWGWTDIGGDRFRELLGRTAGMVYPSCAEACAGTVINSMHAGLVPVVTDACGIDVEPSCGVVIPGFTVEAVREAVRSVSGLAADALRSMAVRSWELARKTYTRERYMAALEQAMEAVMAGETGSTAGFVRMSES